MQKKHYIILILLVSFFTLKAQAQEWKVYASYHNHTKAVKAGARIFVVANDDLFSYDTEDASVETYDKSNALSDFCIYDIAYSAETKTLVVLYKNGNIDLLTEDGDTWNMPELKNKSLDDKTLNRLKVYGSRALVCTNSGVAVVNLKTKNFEGFYSIGARIANAIVRDGRIYISTSKGTHHGELKDNLLDAANWVESNAHAVVFPYANFTNEEAELKAENTKQLEAVKDIAINSPLRNFFYKLNMQGERLLVAGGDFYYPTLNREATVMVYEGGKWTSFDETEPLAQVLPTAYMAVTDVVQDPSDSQHHWVGTARSGIYEFREGKLKRHFTYDNSPLQTILPDSKRPDCYVRVTALAYDPEENIWMCNDETDTIVRIFTKDGKWLSYYYPEVAGFQTFDHTIFDKRGWAWISQRRTTAAGHIAGLLVIDTNGTISTQKDDKHRFVSTFYNQDGASYIPNLYYCMAEDLDGAMWVGTSDGLFVSYTPEEVFSNSFTFDQVKVPRNDGSDLADYLLSSVPVSCITIDGGNRKWIGTLDNGVYLISADGLETIHHFTIENSPLISNNISDIAINGETGEVFIATDLGLCSFQGDATDPEESMKGSSLKAFPNPVRPDYVGDVHVRGVMANSDVKVVNAAGKLVAKGTSVGGQFNWNCCDANGKRVASGIYYILAADEEGNKSAWAKVLVVK